MLLFLSGQTWARELVTGLPVAKTTARRFVAGESIDEAMEVTRALNVQGMSVTLDYLGESVEDESLAISSRNEILRLLDRIEKHDLDANVSVKLTQLGLRIRRTLAQESLQQLLERASKYNNKIRIDMEESELVEATLEIYRQLRDEGSFDNVGVVIQSYLYRSEEDVRRLVTEGAWVRLVKGAYAEPPDISYPRKKDTDENFLRLAYLLLNDKAVANRVHVAFATHDEQIIDRTLVYIREHNVPSDRYEYQMLYGIRRDLQARLVKQGHNVRIYVPYGTAWYPYLVRRLAERPANLWFFLSNLLER